MDRQPGSVTWAARQRGAPLGGRGPGRLRSSGTRQGTAWPIPMVETTLRNRWDQIR